MEKAAEDRLIPGLFGLVHRRAGTYPGSRLISSHFRHPESKSLAPDGTRCNEDTCGLLGRYPVTASGLHLIGQETERGWEQSEDISTILPSLLRYGREGTSAGELLSRRLRQIPLAALQRETGLSRHTIVRARRGERVHPKSVLALRMATTWVLI